MNAHVDRAAAMAARFALPLGALLYAAWAIHVTWPLLPDLDDSVLGPLRDQAHALADMREWIEEDLFPFAPGTFPDFGAPEGRDMDWEVNLTSWPWTLPAWLLSLAIGPAAALAVLIWVGFVLSGVTMQILATRVTGSHLAGVVAGFAFAFFPYTVVKASVHPVFVHGWPLALMAWRMLEVAEAPTRRNTALAAAAAILALGFTPYYLLIGGVLLGTLVALALIRAWRSGSLRSQLSSQAVICAAVGIYVGALAFFALSAGGEELRENFPDDVLHYAARPYEYVVPFADHAVLGGQTSSWLGERLHQSNFGETTLYLGIVVLSLAALAAGWALLRRRERGMSWIAVAGFAVAVVAFVWSLPPGVDVAGITVPTPSKALSEVTTTWRVYSRFVIDVMLGVAVMAAVGVALLIRGRRTVVSAVIAALLLAGMMIDFTSRPGTTKLAAPPFYELLAERPGGFVAEYPLLQSGHGGSSELVYQQTHGHPLVNGYESGSEEEWRGRTLYYLDRFYVARGLASLGVRYVALADDAHDRPIYSVFPDPMKPRRGFRFIDRAPDSATTTQSLYEVTARPDAGYVYLTSGAGWAPDGTPQDPFFWVTSSDAELSVDAPRCPRPCEGTLKLRVVPFAHARTVTLALSDGTTLWRGRVTRQTDVAVPLEVDGRERLTLATDPGPTPISEVDPGNADGRAVSVALFQMRFVKS